MARSTTLFVPENCSMMGFFVSPLTSTVKLTSTNPSSAGVPDEYDELIPVSGFAGTCWGQCASQESAGYVGISSARPAHAQKNETRTIPGSKATVFTQTPAQPRTAYRPGR